MARKKKAADEPIKVIAVPAPGGSGAGNLSAEDRIALRTAPTVFSEEQQNAYARDAQTTGARNVKGYADIHDWYRRTKGGKENG